MNNGKEPLNRAVRKNILPDRSIQWINSDSDVIIFDEFTRGIDVGAKAEIFGIMNDLKKQGKAVIMVSAELAKCMGVSDRIYVMHEGVMSDARIP